MYESGIISRDLRSAGVGIARSALGDWLALNDRICEISVHAGRTDRKSFRYYHPDDRENCRKAFAVTWRMA